jgi:phasin family protein
MSTTTATTTKATKATEAAANDASNLVQDASVKAEAFVADTQKNVTEQFEKLTRSFEGLTAFGQDNVDAVVKSSEIAAKAAEGIGNEISAYSKKAFEEGVAAAQDLATAKTMTELFEKQTAYAQSTFEGFINQATKMNEIYVAAAKDITAPLGARVSAATDAVKSFSL